MDELAVNGVWAGYARTDVLRDVSLAIGPGECVGLLGPNGAGKSTLLRVLSGQLKLHGGSRTLNGLDTGNWRAHRFARAGVRWVGDPRPIFPSLTVLENLVIGGITKRQYTAEEIERVFTILPALREKTANRASSLSGGQQQLLAIGQALMTRPKFLCLDEPSLGLSMRAVEEVSLLIGELVKTGVGIVWAEQFPDVALERCNRIAVLSAGRIVHAGFADSVTTELIAGAYLGDIVHPGDQ